MKARHVLVLFLMICIVIFTFAVFIRELQVWAYEPATAPLVHPTTRIEWEAISAPPINTPESITRNLADPVMTVTPTPLVPQQECSGLCHDKGHPGCGGHCGDGI